MNVNRLLSIVKGLKEFRETGNLKYLYRNDLEKTCFANDFACSDLKDLTNRTISEKILKELIKFLETIYKMRIDGN